MECPKAALFDLDDTLADSFMPPTDEMVARLIRLRDMVPIAVLSGASFERLRSEVLDKLVVSNTERPLFTFPDSASMGYELSEGAWRLAYSIEFEPDELEHIRATVEAHAKQSGIWSDMSGYTPKILLEKTQVRYAALGLCASEADKNDWDPQQTKRRLLKKVLDEQLPDCEVLIGGRTTVDITRKGVDKSHGVEWLSERLTIPPQEMLYVGDALYDGGNDQVVIKTGIRTIETSGPAETLGIIDEMIASCATQ